MKYNIMGLGFNTKQEIKSHIKSLNTKYKETHTIEGELRAFLIEVFKLTYIWDEVVRGSEDKIRIQWVGRTFTTFGFNFYWSYGYPHAEIGLSHLMMAIPNPGQSSVRKGNLTLVDEPPAKAKK
jgi:hypothetical protein